MINSNNQRAIFEKQMKTKLKVIKHKGNDLYSIKTSFSFSTVKEKLRALHYAAGLYEIFRIDTINFKTQQKHFEPNKTPHFMYVFRLAFWEDK